MPLHCQILSRDTVSKINQEILKLPITNPLHKESMDGDITVVEKNGCAIYHSAAGFYFNRIIHNLEDAIIQDIRNPREYLCSAFEIQTGDNSVRDKLLKRFQEKYGKKYFNMIDYQCLNYNDKNLMLVKFPSCIVRQMLSPTGGNMRTVISGPRGSLEQIPTLVRLGNIGDQERPTSVFVTQYGPNMLKEVNQIHYDILREVLTKPNMGITVMPFMVWDP
jgi:hypothetical protein